MLNSPARIKDVPVDTLVLTTQTLAEMDAAVRRAAELLRGGQPVGIPTETVYGLAANAFDPAAVRRLFEVKNRPAHNPLITHVHSIALAKECAAAWPQEAQLLADAFWPGPLTIVLPRSSRIPDVVTAGGPTVAIRWPRHPFVQKLIAACGFPLAAPSANPSGAVSPTTAQHVWSSLGGRIALIVDGGPSNVGIESTVVDVTSEPVRVLRPGIVQAEALAGVLGRAVSQGGAGAGELRSPGMLERHYAPKARVVVLAWATEEELAERLRQMGIEPSAAHVLAHTSIPGAGHFGHVSVVPHDPQAFARALYAELHGADQRRAAVIVVEAVPEEGSWRGIADRLRRAAWPR